MNKPITGASIDRTIVHLANVLESLRVEFAPGKPATGRFADALATVDELRQVVAALALENDNARGVLELLRTQGWRSEDDVVQIERVLGLPVALARARALLERFEWSAGDTPDVCPVCAGYKPNHGPGCELGAVLSAGAPMPVSTAAAHVSGTVYDDTLQGGDETKKS